MEANSEAKTIQLDFLQAWAQDRQHAVAEPEQAVLASIHTALLEADEIFVYLGGRAGRLGESIVGTALLEGTLQALRYTGHTGIPIHIIVDHSILELFDSRQYQIDYWPQISIAATTQPGAMVEVSKRLAPGRHILIVDCHGAHDGMPYLTIQSEQSTVTTLAQLFRVGIRSYAQRGTDRRYADFIEELFTLPHQAIAGELAQPTLRLSMQDRARSPELARSFNLDPTALQIVCFFQSIVLAKCYERWYEVMQALCEYLALHFPQQRIDFLLACGPEEDLPESVKQEALIEEFQGFTGTQDNARVLVHPTPSLHELAILISGAAFVLANDTGPGHMAGALHVPTITPYLPGNIYSKRVWASTPWHHGVTVEPNPYSYQQLESAILWGNTTMINSIPPQVLLENILACLPKKP